MIISKIIFNNFKAFEGEQILECDIKNPQKPIILVGGRNGVGKTSIIEGVKLCLYGSLIKQNTINYSSYNEFLLNMHNNNAKERNENFFSIAVEFKIEDIGRSSFILIERKWTKKTDSYSESLVIKRDNEEIDFILPNFWQDYINDLSPIGLSHFIYFNSEEFQTVPKHLENGFSNALLKFFGVDSYIQLDADLSRHLTFLGSKYDKKLSKEIAAFQSELKKIQDQEKLVREDLLLLKSKLLQIGESKKHIENNLAEKAGEFASKQGQLIHNKEQILNSIKENQHKYEEIASEILPFTLAPQLVQNLKKQLLHERKVKEIFTLRNKLDDIKSSLKIKLKGKVDDIDAIVNELEAFTPTLPNKIKITHDLTSARTEKIINYLEKCQKTVKKLLFKNRREYSRLKSDFSIVNIKLGEIKPTGPSHVLYNKLGNINQQYGSCEGEIKNKTLELKKIEKRIKYLDIKVNAGQKKLVERAKSDKKITLINNTRLVIAHYKDYLVDQRFSEFEFRFKEILDKLTVKGDLINKLGFDFDTNKITFYDKNNSIIPPTKFSAGESEIIALSILFAVFNTVNSLHPIITDSPLNRLDKRHRSKVIDNLLKSSSRQIIFLSTDEEIENPDFYGLEQYIQSKKSIEYNNQKGSSSFSNRYFE